MRAWLKDRRVNVNLTQQEVADYLGVHISHYSNIENGTRQKDMDMSLIVKLSEVLKMPIDEIVQNELELHHENN